MLIRKFYFIILVVVSCVYLHAQPIGNQLKEFDAYVEKARAQWQVPGLAVAVIKDGQIIFKKGYGVRKLGNREEVNTQTIFACASTTKAMTAACMAMLVDEAKVNWNDPVIKYLPDFKLYDSYVTRELKVRDLFTHNSGVGNADFLWGVMDISSEEVLKKMALVKPSYSLRSSFIYQNIFYLAAGKIIEKVSGQTWGEFITTRLFKPLNMNRTYATHAGIKDANHSTPHFFYQNAVHAIDPDTADSIGPAGSVNSCIDDISLWMQCMLDSSKFSGGRLLKGSTWAELFKPQVIVPADEFYPTMQLLKPNWITYGLGWFQHDYQGKKVNYHTGSLAGEVAIHAQLPEAKLGIYVFANYDHAEVRHALVYKTFDLFALGGKRDWSSEFLQLYGGLKAKSGKAANEDSAKRIFDTKPSLPLEAYEGTYTDALYGMAEVKIVNGNLFINLNNFLKATAHHWHYDTFRAAYEKAWYGKATAQFYLDTTGKVTKLEFDGLTFEKPQPSTKK